MLTTTIDGLWVLQVLSGIEVLAPELGLRPHLPSVETRRSALDHPVSDELRSSGVIDGRGELDPPVLEWLTVIARCDIAVVVHVVTPTHDGPPRRAVVARFAGWWAVLERSDHLVRVSGAGTGSAAGSGVDILRDQIERLCGAMDPSAIRPITLDLTRLVNEVRNRSDLRRQLLAAGLDADQVRTLALASDTTRSAQASIAAVQTGVDTDGPVRTVTGAGSLCLVDTPEGRLLYETLSRDGKQWMVIGPGTTTAMVEALHRLLCQLPANQQWHSYRKKV